MDHPRDRLRARLVGTTCTACGAATRADQIRLLASRDDLVFARVRCDACGSESLAIVTLVMDESDRRIKFDGAAYGEFGPIDEARFASARPLTDDDVRAMRDFLAAFQGDISGLLDSDGSAGGGAGGGP